MSMLTIVLNKNKDWNPGCEPNRFGQTYLLTYLLPFFLTEWFIELHVAANNYLNQEYSLKIALCNVYSIINILFVYLKNDMAAISPYLAFNKQKSFVYVA